MDYVMLALAAIAGGLIYHIMFGGRRAGPFEESLMFHLSQGRRVTVTIDKECFIFEMFGDRMRVTRGIADYLEEPYDPDLADSGSNKSVDSIERKLSDL